MTVRAIDELSNLIEDHGWDPELIDAVKARLAALEKVARIAAAGVQEGFDGGHELDLEDALRELKELN